MPILKSNINSEWHDKQLAFFVSKLSIWNLWMATLVLPLGSRQKVLCSLEVYICSMFDVRMYTIRSAEIFSINFPFSTKISYLAHSKESNICSSAICYISHRTVPEVLYILRNETNVKSYSCFWDGKKTQSNEKKLKRQMKVKRRCSKRNELTSK